MNKEKLMYALEHPDTLPERAYHTMPSDKKTVIIVVNGERGYYHYQTYETEQQAEETCKYCNENIAFATDVEAEALMILSMRN